MVTTGGTGLKDDILRLEDTVHIIIGTPGRIADLARKEIVKLDECTTFVMDEADKLLSPEFTPTIEQLLSFHPKERQVMLFSATFPIIVKSFKVSVTLRFSWQQLMERSGQTHEQPLRNQPHGRTHPSRNNPILLLRGREAESPLPQHSIL